MSIEFERRLNALEAAQEQTDQTLAQVLQRIDVTEGETKRTWRAIESEAEERARIGVRLEKLEGAFESQWNVLRRLEIGALETRRDMQVGFREIREEVRDGFAAIGAQIRTT